MIEKFESRNTELPTFPNIATEDDKSAKSVATVNVLLAGT